MEVTEETTAAKAENMQYYHIAPPDLGRDISPSPDDENDEDDDPNWLIMSTRESSSVRNDGRTNVIVRRTCSAADSGTPPRNGNNRLNRLLEGVTAAFIGPTGDEDADVIVGGNARAPLPAYYQDDPIAARICELFDEMEPLEKIFAGNNNLAEADEVELAHPAVVQLRPKAAKGGGGGGSGGIFGRKKQAVSGYFSDWTKWLRGPEITARGAAAASEGSGRSGSGSAKCNGRE